jgi:thioester reductase-like protein
MTSHQPTQAQIVADSHLPPEITFTKPLSPYCHTPRAACLTGATGFLGGYLLHELMTRTQADAYCLVRGSDVNEAETRLIAHLSNYGLWNEAYRPRIHAVPVHDLADPQFGMDDAAYRELAAKLDVIYHSAGSLNMAFPYDRLKRTNVTGTLEVLRLAGAEVTKPVHFLSSMVVFFTDAHLDDTLLTEADAPRFHETLKGGYGRSKWVADRLVADAGAHGLPVTIHRPVRVMGTAATGAMIDLSDILPLMLKACVMMGQCPELDVRVTMVPVDYVTSAMVHMAGSADGFGRAFHYFHPNPAPWNDMMAMIRQIGYTLEPLSLENWKRALKKRAASKTETKERREFFSNAFLAVISPHFLFYRRPPMDAGHLEQGLAGTGIVYPEIDAALMRTYFTYWQQVGFVPAPAEAG